MNPELVCSFEGCTNNQKHKASGLCLAHRRMQVRGEALRPIHKSVPQESPVCTGPSCDRPSEAHSLCKGHGRQLRQAGELWAFGDKERAAKVRKDRWERLSPEAKVAWVAKVVASRPKVRTEDHIRKQSESSRASWKRKIETGIPERRYCASCNGVFECVPKVGGLQVYCSPECKGLSGRLRRYGLSRDAYDSMLKEQDGKCALCRGDWTGWGGSTTPRIDHCHTTGQVRGLLCGNCNTAIGRFGDDPQRLHQAAQYLERAANTAA